MQINTLYLQKKIQTNTLKTYLIMITDKQLFNTNYRVATQWLNNSFVLCNNIVEIDDSIFDNMEFDYYDEENDCYRDIFQWYISDCSEWDKNFLKEHFGLLFTYSEKLDCFILCVDHLGTSWNYVYCTCDFENAKRELGEEK